MSFTTKQRVFIDEYLSNGFNATKAALSAGYSENNARFQGYENLTKPHIWAEIQKELAAKTLKKEQVLKVLTDFALGSIADQDTKDQLRALELIGKHFGLFTDKVSVTWEQRLPQGYDAEDVKAKFARVLLENA